MYKKLLEILAPEELEDKTATEKLNLGDFHDQVDAKWISD
jgi:hypothetical protein